MRDWKIKLVKEKRELRKKKKDGQSKTEIIKRVHPKSSEKNKSDGIE